MPAPAISGVASNAPPALPVRYDPSFLDSDYASELLADLLQNLPWHTERITLFGRACDVPRQVGWCGDAGLDYGYAGVRHPCTGWYAPLDELRTKLAQDLATDFNFVLANRYRTGADHMGWHSDDEPELGSQPVVASISLGATRRFRIRAKGGGACSLGYDLAHGSLLVAWGNCQRDFQHCITRTRRPVAERINLSFRWVGALGRSAGSERWVGSTGDRMKEMGQ